MRITPGGKGAAVLPGPMPASVALRLDPDPLVVGNKIRQPVGNVTTRRAFRPKSPGPFRGQIQVSGIVLGSRSRSPCSSNGRRTRASGGSGDFAFAAPVKSAIDARASLRESLLKSGGARPRALYPAAI